MIIACIACGGIIETWIIVVGLGALLRWLRKKHKKNECNCCKEHENEKKK